MSFLSYLYNNILIYSIRKYTLCELDVIRNENLKYFSSMGQYTWREYSNLNIRLSYTTWSTVKTWYCWTSKRSPSRLLHPILRHTLLENIEQQNEEKKVFGFVLQENWASPTFKTSFTMVWTICLWKNYIVPNNRK